MRQRTVSIEVWTAVQFRHFKTKLVLDSLDITNLFNIIPLVIILIEMKVELCK